MQYLVPLSPKLPQTLIQQLSQILRYSLPTPSHTLKLPEQLTYIHQYLPIQNIPFHDIIHLYIHPTDPLQHQTIPNIILQPLVQNPINHPPNTEPLNITIPITLTKPKLHILVHDNGIG
ncbi:sensor histidine kinase, partial [Staphylococcus epidermidis]|uniref:sensor histidine kinase n=1 Tax=Staphylococcus epidermidis TaxID=1282 RepID=UPI0021B1D8BF